VDWKKDEEGKKMGEKKNEEGKEVEENEGRK
jgi:hypothetical protein